MRLTVRHLLVTAVPAPVNLYRRTHSGDPAALARVFDSFAPLTIRTHKRRAVTVG